MANTRSDSVTDAYTFEMPSPNPVRRLAAAASLRARRRMFDRFMAIVRPTEATRVLDVGVSPEGRLADVNAFESFYPWPWRITATSIEDAKEIELRYPGLRFVHTSGETLPFENWAFDIVVSSAVIEHVGDRAAQQRHLRELLRVGRRVFIATPNRWFPVDPHTMLPIVHWLPQRYHQQVLTGLGKTFWADTANLNLLTARELLGLFPDNAGAHLARERTLGFTSNLMAYA
jgi:SAM-dependent methyltransferase